MANETDHKTANLDKDRSSQAIAIILPCLFAIILVILITIAFLLPRITAEESPASKDERRKKRLARLDKSVQAEHFVDWAKKQRDEHPEIMMTMNPLCVICLDEIEDAAQIRGLGCFHVFHQQCLDDWFGRWNEYCPLCHRPIIQAIKARKSIRGEGLEPPPVAHMV